MDYLKTQYDIVKIDPNVNYESEDESDDCEQSSVDMDIEKFSAADQVDTAAFVNEKSNQIVAELSPQQNLIKFKEKEVDKHVNENRSSYESNSLPRDSHIILQETADTTIINKDKNDNDIVMEIHSNDSKLVVEDNVVVIAGDGNNNTNKQKEHPVQIDMEVDDNTLTSNLTTLNVVICDNSSNTVDSLSITPNSDNGASAADAVEGCTKKVKKKLNLQEYKMRRGNPSMTCSLNDVKDTLLEGIPKDTPTSLPPIPLPDLNNPGATVPQQQQNECDQEMAELDHDPEEFEEIIIVSIGCNTQMSIDPKEAFCETNKESENKKTDEEESTSLNSIVNNLKKDNKLSNSSLLASIQNVVTQKKQMPPVSTSTETVQPKITSEAKTKTEGEEQDHGEDKVIMHLSKYRQRPEMKTMATQTDSLPQFPPLVLLIKKCASKNPHTNVTRNYRIRKVSGRSKTRSRSRSTSRSSAVSNYVSKRQRTTSFSQRNKSLSSSMYSSSSSSDCDSDYSKKSRRARSRTYSYSCSSSSSDSDSDSSSDSSQSSSASYDRDREQRARRSRLCSFRSNKSTYSNRSNYSQGRGRSFSRSRSRSSRRSKSPRHHLFYENNRRRNSRAKQNFNRNANITAEREFASLISICNNFNIKYFEFQKRDESSTLDTSIQTQPKKT